MSFQRIAPIMNSRGLAYVLKVNRGKGVKLHMKRKKIILGAAFAVMSSLMVAGPASAAHCVSPEGTSPGFSYFGQDGREDGNAKGASACRDATGSPSERAPGQNK